MRVENDKVFNFGCQVINVNQNLSRDISTQRFSCVQSVHSLVRNGGDKSVIQGSLQDIPDDRLFLDFWWLSCNDFVSLIRGI